MQDLSGKSPAENIDLILEKLRKFAERVLVVDLSREEVAVPVVASMFTTVAVFMPLLAMEGEVGAILRGIPTVVIVALAVSLVEAFLVLPNHLKTALPKAARHRSRVRRAIDQSVRWCTHRAYGPLLAWSIRRPLIPVAALMMLLLTSMKRFCR